MNSRKINNKIDEVNAILRNAQKEEDAMLKKHLEDVYKLKVKKNLAFKR